MFRQTVKMLIAPLGLGLALAAAGMTVAAEPPSEEVIQSKVEAMRQWMQAQWEASGRIDDEAAAAKAKELLEGIDIDELSYAQIDEMQMLIGSVDEAMDAAKARLEKLANEPNEDGAKSAFMVYLMSFDESDTATKAKQLNHLFHHPAFAEAFEAGGIPGLFMYVNYSGDEVVSAIEPELVKAASLFDEKTSPMQLADAADYLKILQNHYETIPAEKREAIRAKLLELTEAAIATLGEDSGRVGDALERNVEFYNSPIGRGEFLGHPAPEISFIWSNSPTPLSSLADLKGKVVVLDFWATWCGPCIASFPSVRKLKAHYDGYDVAIVGVTSIQGAHFTPEHEQIDTEGNPEKEFELMKDFIKQMDMTWTIAFSEQEVFNPDYGVEGIPHVAIIDAKGNVRYNGLHPSSEVTPFAEKTAKIDKLLNEAGLKTPEAEKTDKD